MKTKRITVKTKGIHGILTYNFYDAKYFINPDTKTVFFSGHANNTKRNGRELYSKLLPYQLIISVEVEDYDGGLLVCNDIRCIEWLKTTQDIYKSMSVIEMVER